MRTRVRLVGLVAAAVVVAGCGTAQPSASTSAATSGPEPEAIALVVTDGGLAGVPVGSSTPRWTIEGAVAAPDGSAVFALDPADDGERHVVRIDPRDGAVTRVGPVASAPGLHVAAVEPDGRRVVLAWEGPGDSTVILTLDPERGVPLEQQQFDGVLEPEALSLDGQSLFAARIYGDRYHVHVLRLSTGEQYPTIGPDKTQPPEDMYGSVVQAALSPDGRQLATLYRDDSTPAHTAFVHLLSLENGTTVCIDLHAPFGTSSAPGADAIAWRGDGSVAVGHRPASGSPAVATFSPAAIWAQAPQAHHHAEVGAADAPPTIPDGVAATAGFRRFVALVQ